LFGYEIAFIPILVIAVILMLSFITFNLKLYFELGLRPGIVTFLFIGTYSGLSFALSNEKPIIYFFATIITLFAAIAPRCCSLIESYRQYQYILTSPEDTQYRTPFIRRVLDILPDLVVILLIFSLASDVRKELELNALWLTIFYMTSFFYTFVVAVYIAITDKINSKTYQ